MIGLGPMLDTIASRNIFGITDNTSQNQPKVYTFDDTTPFNCANIKSALNTNLKDPAYADFAFGHSSLAQNTDKTGYIIQSGTNFEMPVLLTPTDTSFTYYYPTKHLPFYSNNWYVTDINKVTNYVEKSNA
jgi:hypothetical protein